MKEVHCKTIHGQTIIFECEGSMTLYELRNKIFVEAKEFPADTIPNDFHINYHSHPEIKGVIKLLPVLLR